MASLGIFNDKLTPSLLKRIFENAEKSGFLKERLREMNFRGVVSHTRDFFQSLNNEDCKMFYTHFIKDEYVPKQEMLPEQGIFFKIPGDTLDKRTGMIFFDLLHPTSCSWAKEFRQELDTCSVSVITLTLQLPESLETTLRCETLCKYLRLALWGVPELKLFENTIMCTSSGPLTPQEALEKVFQTVKAYVPRAPRSAGNDALNLTFAPRRHSRRKTVAEALMENPNTRKPQAQVTPIPLVVETEQSQPLQQEDMQTPDLTTEEEPTVALEQVVKELFSESMLPEAQFQDVEEGNSTGSESDWESFTPFKPGVETANQQPELELSGEITPMWGSDGVLW